MTERAQIEVAAQFAVDAEQHIQIERRAHAERVVVGQRQVALGFHEIGADEERVAGRE